MRLFTITSKAVKTLSMHHLMLCGFFCSTTTNFVAVTSPLVSEVNVSENEDEDSVSEM